MNHNSSNLPQNANHNRDGEASPVSDALVDLELISGLIRTLSIIQTNNNFLKLER